MGRLYLPREALADAGIANQVPRQGAVRSGARQGLRHCCRASAPPFRRRERHHGPLQAQQRSLSRASWPPSIGPCSTSSLRADGAPPRRNLRHSMPLIIWAVFRHGLALMAKGNRPHHRRRTSRPVGRSQPRGRGSQGRRARTCPPCRRPMPFLFRTGSWPHHRQRQSPAAFRQSRRARFPEDHRRSDRLVGPDAAEFAFADLASGMRWSGAAQHGASAVVDLLAATARARKPSAFDYLPLARLLMVRRRSTRSEMCYRAVECSTTACCGRYFLPRSIPSRPSPRRRSQAPSCAKPWQGGTRVPAARCRRRPRSCVHRSGNCLSSADTASKSASIISCARSTSPTTASVLSISATTRSMLSERRRRHPRGARLGRAVCLSRAFQRRRNTSAILNAHFKIAPPLGFPSILGVLNATTEWLFAFPDRISVTVSAADRFIEAEREPLARQIWSEVASLTGQSDAAAAVAPCQGTKGHVCRAAAGKRRRPGPANALA